MNVVMLELLVIFGAAVLAAVLLRYVPGQILPEGVALIGVGVAVGPDGLGWVAAGETLSTMSNIGVGLLFLLAGYEIEPRSHFGPAGRRAALVWLLSLVLGFGVGWAVREGWLAAAAVGIALVPTALGTITPVLKARGVGAGTRFGDAVLRHGTAGQMGTPIALAIILGTSGAAGSAIALAVFLGLVVVLFAVPTFIRAHMGWLSHAIRSGADTASQTDVRVVMLVLVGLLVATGFLGLDAVTAAFLAGVVIREAFPAERSNLADELHAVAFGVFLPVFYVVVGANIDVAAVASHPWIIVAFLVANLAVRALPVAVYSRAAEHFSVPESLQIGLYSAVGLSLVAAVAQVAVQAGIMASGTRSALIVSACLGVMLYTAGARALATRAAQRA